MEKKNKEIVGSLQRQAWRRATNLNKPNSGTPHDWEDFEKINEKKNEQNK